MTAGEIAAIALAVPVIYIVFAIRRRQRISWALEYLHIDVVKGALYEEAEDWDGRHEFLVATVEQQKELLKIRGRRECMEFILAHATGDDQAFLLRAVGDFWNNPDQEASGFAFSFKRKHVSFIPSPEPIERHGDTLRLFKPRWYWIEDLNNLNRAVNIINDR